MPSLGNLVIVEQKINKHDYNITFSSMTPLCSLVYSSHCGEIKQIIVSVIGSPVLTTPEESIYNLKISSGNTRTDTELMTALQNPTDMGHYFEFSVFKSSENAIRHQNIYIKKYFSDLGKYKNAKLYLFDDFHGVNSHSSYIKKFQDIVKSY